MKEQIGFVRASSIYNDSRATKEILALTEAGYRVKVFAWNRDGLAAIRCSEVFLDVDTVEFVFYENETSNGLGMRNISKLIGWLLWLRKQLNASDKLIALHACDFDSGICAWRYCVKNGSKLIYDIYDYYVDAHNIPTLLERFVAHFENSIINSADITIICTEERREQIKDARPKKVIVIYNSPDIRELPCTEIEYDYVYCGTLIPQRLIGEILEEYPQHSKLRIAFGGYGIYAFIAENLSEKYKCFHFSGALKYTDVLTLEAKAAVLSAIYEPTIRNHRLCAPNKFYEALALGKPVIVCRGTGIDKIVEENGIGIVIDYDVDAFYNALSELLNDGELRREIGTRARELYVSKYCWSAMKDIMQCEYKNLLDEYDTIA